MRKALNITVAVVVVALLTAGLSIGAWQLGWFVEEKNTERRGRIDQETYQRQNALVEAMLDDVREVRSIDISAAEAPSPQLDAQRTAIVSQICDSAAKLNGTIDLDVSTQAFVTVECP
jgi:hypothetical protein